MSESKLQTKIVNFLKKDGYFVYKNINLSINGVPDLTIIKNGVVTYIEVKDKGKKPTELQQYRINELISNGVNAFYVDSYECFIKEIKRNKTKSE